MLSAQSQLPLLIQHVADGQELSSAEIEQAVHDLLEPSIRAAEKTEFLRCLARRGEVPREIANFAIHLRDLAVDPRIDLKRIGGDLLDLSCTGMGSPKTFDVSTAAAFVLAAGEVPVVRQCRLSVSSHYDGVETLRGLGINAVMAPERLRESVETLKIGFVVAPLYYEALDSIQPVLDTLAREKTRTIFNLAAPLINPARSNIQIIGVGDPNLAETYAQALHLMKPKRATVIHGFDTHRLPCMEAMSTLSYSRVAQLHSSGKIETLNIDTDVFNMKKASLADIKDGSPATNVRIIKDLFNGKDKGPRRDFLLLNASMGFALAGKTANMEQGLRKAAEILDGGAALIKLQACRAFQQDKNTNLM
jgi:anthranilate phosphoribosyltransferase